MIRIFISIVLLSICHLLFAQNKTNYKVPPSAIADIALAPSTPNVIIDPQRIWLLQLGVPEFPSIQELTKLELRIGGIRFNPENYGQSRDKFNDSLMLTNLQNGKDYLVEGLPAVQKFSNYAWSANGKYVAFTNTTQTGVELWLLDVNKKIVKQLTEPIVNNCLPGNPIVWADHGEWIIFTAINTKNNQKPTAKNSSEGPLVRDTDGKESAVRTFQDLLKSPNDAELFEYYTTSQLMKISINKESYPIGEPAIFKEFSMSPDMRFLLVKMIKKPFSYLVPYTYFPFWVEIWDNEGNIFREVFKIPLSENIPTGIGAVRTGPREINWRSDVPSSLYWVRALDGGDPSRKAITRDRLFLFDAPFDGNGYESIAFEYRFGDIIWGKNDFAISTEWWWATRTEKVCQFNPSKPELNKKVLFEYNWQDEYALPGTFLTHTNINGHSELVFGNKGTELYLEGQGATPEGYRPFINRYTIASQATERLWQSNDPYYEFIICDANIDKQEVVTRRESNTDVPNYFIRNLGNGVVSQITNFQHPYPQMLKVKSEFVKYKRADGIQLTARLYLPPGYTVGDGLLPVLMWAYPDDYKTAASANQVKDSPNRFPYIRWWSPLFFVMQGYAVLDNPSMPIIGSENSEPNDNFVEQLVKDAEAAIACLDSLAIADKNKIAIGGHSYGAFMAANLLAHTNLFAAGIARSGAYNRTLTPFGFQSEERTFWEARDSYMNMSPFNYANKIDKPLLLIHGDADNNSGTFPLQSERMFTALKGNGKTARLVMLPGESHSYQSKESILHMLWEMDNWLNKYVKQKP